MAGCVVVDCGAGNLRSVAKALEYVAESKNRVVVSREPDEIAEADRLVIPGQGSYGETLASLREPPALLEALLEGLTSRAVPVLGICVGLQLMGDTGYERVISRGLGFLGGEVTKLPLNGVSLPHIGWSDVRRLKPHPLLVDWGDSEMCYFAHSYVLDCDPEFRICATDHGREFVSAAARANFFGTQFHPEKSSYAGLSLLKRFLSWRP